MKFSKKKETLKFTSSKGITLIALVITIIVLLILAGVSIGSIISDNGILSKAKKAQEKTEAGTKEETEYLESLEGYIQESTDNGITIKEAMAKDGALSETKNTKVIDNFGNLFIVPAGFRIVKDGESNVTYSYVTDSNGNSTGIPSVQDGIVIEDVILQNQFVWIPVGNIKNNDGSTTAMPLARYEFYDAYSPSTFAKRQDATSLLTNNDDIVDIIHEGDSTIIFHELVNKVTSDDGVPSNEVAKNLIEFINSAINKHGFYIARYEAGAENFDETKSENALAEMEDYIEDINYDSSLIDYDYSANWTAFRTSNNSTPKVVSKPGYQAWNYITQIKASEVSQNMYNSTKFVTDLTNSFAWDTAVVFLTTYANSDYALGNFGSDYEFKLSGDSTDVYCNIFDLSGNYAEWSTENYYYIDYYTDEGVYDGSSVLRGGSYIPDYISVNYSLSRNVSQIDSCNSGITFRPLLYIK